MSPPERTTRRVVGAMTGTSIDAIDVALVEIDGAGLDMRARLIEALSRPLSGLEGPLRTLARQLPVTAAQVARIATDFGELHARAIADLLSSARSRVDLVCAHGQTLFHEPPISLQLLNAAPIAERVRAPVVYDLRQADLAARGQGAPITPIADWILFRSANEARAVVNLGGFCNFTLLPAAPHNHSAQAWLDTVAGFDVCACNQVLDEVARIALNRPYDVGGAVASRGAPDPAAMRELRTLLDRQRWADRSLGTKDEAHHWASAWKPRLRSADLARTACEAIGAVIAEAIVDAGVNVALFAGGGVHNAALMDAINFGAGERVRVQTTTEFGVPTAYREAVCMAILGALCQDGVPITLPAVTGRRAGHIVSGAWLEAPP